MGRPAGAKNTRTLELEQTAERLGFKPFEVLCHFAMANYEKLGLKPADITAKMRLDAAMEACGYLYSKRRSVEVKNEEGNGFEIIVKDYTVKK